MMTPAEIERKVRQLDNDVQSIYGMLAEVSITQRRHGNRLSEIDGKLDAMDGKLTLMDGRLDAMDGKLTLMDGRLDAMDGKLTSMDGRLDAMDVQLTSMDGKLISMLDLLRSDRPVGP